MAVLAEDVILAPDELPAEVEAWVETKDPNVVEAYIEGDEAIPDAEQAPAIDPILAPRLARRRAVIERQLAEVQSAYKSEVDRLKLWRDAEVRTLELKAARMDFLFDRLLYAAQTLDPKLKTIRLPFGVTVATRKVPASIARRDTRVAACEALTRFAVESAPDCVKPEVDWDALREHLTATPEGSVVYYPTGEALPIGCGVVYTPEHQSVSVKVALEGDA